ncbi:MAG: AbrB/MazE/SpoVT family DNA-binding domain-containing protein [Candidatus Hydrothermarchaeaceae archaeon]
MEGEITTLTLAKPDTKSLRTTVPAGIVRQFKLKKGDKLSWEIEPRGGELVVVVRPKKGR